jgi:AraC-like DNA-binding protein
MEVQISLIRSVDRYWDDIRGANMHFIITSRPIVPWRLARLPGRQSAVQIGVGGGGSVSDGTTPDGVCTLLWLYEEPDKPTFLNGETARTDQICLLPPNSRFIANSEGTRMWMSVSIPTAVFSAHGHNPQATHPKLVASDSVATMISLVRAYEAAVASDPGSPRLASIEQQIIERSAAIFGAGASPADLPAAEFQKSFKLVSAALDYMRPEQLGHVRMEQLADINKVSPRTMLRAFQQVMCMSTKRYLQLRQLNLARRALVRAVDPFETVTDILLRVGVTEFGRFAGAYQTLFGELPSQTLTSVRRRTHDAAPAAVSRSF